MSKKSSAKLITWVDSSTINRGGWTEMERVNPKPCCLIESIGWIVRSDPHSIVIAGCESEEGQFARLMAIPRGSIKRIRNIK